jgi:hypothetical protein
MSFAGSALVAFRRSTRENLEAHSRGVCAPALGLRKALVRTISLEALGMIQVNVWESAWGSYLPGGQAGSPGHASILVGGIYVSFWPGREAGTLRWRGFNTKTYSEDCESYRSNNQERWSRAVPDDSTGPGLNETRMQQRWEEIKKSGLDYTWEFQCSAVVNELLIAGGSRDFVPSSLFVWTSWYVGAVSPSDVRDYTETLIEAIQKVRRY